MALLQTGSTGTAVVNLQKQLQQIGYQLPKFGADGRFGNETYNAVTDFQRKNSLKIDGIVGPNTQSKLNEKTSSMWDKVTNIFSPSPAYSPSVPMPPVPPAPTNNTQGVSTPAIAVVIPEVMPPGEGSGIHPLVLAGGAFGIWKIFFSRRSRR